MACPTPPVYNLLRSEYMSYRYLSAVFVLAASAAPLAFEVASVKPAAPCCAPGQWRESQVLDDRVDLRYVTMRYCVALAYGLKEYQVFGPGWIGEVRYDIVAKGPEGTRRAQLPEMMQALLVERFQLQVHREKREFNVFALIVDRNGPQLKAAVEEPGMGAGANFGISMAAGGVGRLQARQADMTALSNTLLRLVGRPVVDLSGLTGRYDFELEFSREDATGMIRSDAPADPANDSGTSIFRSIQRIGLRLEPRKLPLDTIVVDKGERTATEN